MGEPAAHYMIMPAHPSITPPTSIGHALAPLAYLSDEQFEILRNATSSARGFALNAAQIKALAAQIPPLTSQLTFVLAALSYLYSEIEKLENVEETYSPIVRSLVTESEVETELGAKLQDRLERLLQKNEGLQRFRKIRRLQGGFIPNATGFRTLVDLRPDFGDDETVDYKGLIKVIQFRVLTDSDDPALQRMVFQMTEESLAEMGKALERAHKKLDALNKESRLSSQFIEVET